MGRTFDALRHTNGNGAVPTVLITPAQAPARVVPEAKALVEETEIPFIEVGGPRNLLEASASVLAQPSVRPASHQPKPAAKDSLPRSLPLPPIAITPRDDSVKVSFQAVGATAVAKAGCIAPELIAFHRPDDPASEPYRSLWKAIAGQCPIGGNQVLTFVSAGKGTGTTTVLLNLAVVAARTAAVRVAVIDGNLRNPMVAERLGLGAAPGFLELIAGKVAVQRALRTTFQSNLFVLPSGAVPLLGNSWPGVDAVKSAVRQIRQHADVVLIDAPSWDEGPEMASLVAAADAVYFVVRPTEVESPRVAEMRRLVPHLGSDLAGFILVHR